MTVSLRARLMVGLVVLAAVGLVVADTVTYSSLRSFLNGRIDDQLVAAREPMLRLVARDLFDGPGGFRPPPRGSISVPPGTYGEVRNSDGTVLGQSLVGYEVDVTPPSFGDLPDTRPATFSRDNWRVRVDDINVSINGAPATVLVAVPLTEAHRTLTRLLQIELLVAGFVLAGLAALAWWVVRLGLRPLEAMGETAGAIAAGDLSRRVEPADDRTEVGRLGRSLNSMLQQIEQAFAERTESENRLRRFVADAAHELRTPLTSIRGYAELFRRGAADRPDDLAKSMTRIEGEAERMGVLVDDLLLLARLDQGRPLERHPVDLAAIVTDAAFDARAVDPERPITTVGTDGFAVITGDDGRLRQAVHNLVGNALVHTPAATPVEISVGAENGHAVIAVVDHGEGIDEDAAAHVFERFYRVDESRTREDGGGAGLGLSIVAAIAAAHGGRAELAGTPGGGATFRLLLPTDDSPAGAPSPVA